ncbi:hypothetical protein MACJ_000457 [Theileria orientalis]|uniref:RRM domain-containing protein n=1 Tax=Theileria orientalis TaxID=68886 RepID=A0A976M429_THEOR|nr:hypothetical protein MACJ_000457 [Theileria orientalis]
MAGRDRNIRLFVGNLPYDTTEEELRAMLHGCGTLRYLAIRKDYHTNKSRGYGNIEYRTEAECIEAIKRLGSLEVKGRPVKVDFCDDYYRDKYTDVLMDTLYQKENSQTAEMEQMHTQGMGPVPYNMPVPQPGMPPMGHPDRSPYGQPAMGPMEQSGYGLVQSNVPMAQSNVAMVQSNVAMAQSNVAMAQPNRLPIPQTNLPMVQPNLPLVQPEMPMFPQASMGLMQPAVPLMPPPLTQPHLTQPPLTQPPLVQPGLMPSGLVQPGLAQPTMAPMVQIPADISQLDPLEGVQAVGVAMDQGFAMDPGLSQQMATHAGHRHYQNQPMPQQINSQITHHINSQIAQQINSQITHHINSPINNMGMPLNQPLPQQLGQPLSQPIKSPTSQQGNMAVIQQDVIQKAVIQQFATQVKHRPGNMNGLGKVAKPVVGRSGQTKEPGDYAKYEHKRYRAEEELLLENGKVVSRDLFRLIKKMSMMDVYNLVKKIDILMQKSPNTARSILNSSSSMRSALMHAKLLLGYKNLNFSHLSNAKVSNIFEYFVIR